MNCGQMCKLLIMKERDLLLEECKVKLQSLWDWIEVTLLANIGPYRNTTSMARLCITQFGYVGLNIFLVIFFVLANKDSCGSVFETGIGK